MALFPSLPNLPLQNTASGLTTTTWNIQTPSPIDDVALAAKGILLTPKDGKNFRKPWPKCMHCHKEGHTIERCYFIYRFPPSSRKPSLGSKPSAHQFSSADNNPSINSFSFTLDQCEQLLAMLNTATQSSSMANHVGNIASSLSGKPPLLSPETLSILDSEATNHMVCSPSDLTYSILVCNRIVQLPNGSHVVDLRSMRMIGLGTERDGLYYFTRTNPARC
ncbi:hypothetical protein F0562_030517 [Nyssa sinensis]|uniref:Uncharacterized protein n=1 Tax=Nyssa sinensis TaxID=561372 RepID=A0A5J5AYI8_9ASTE|nr:hypothetical protein F0562_030517 [Nyssa sinensis]